MAIGFDVAACDVEGPGSMPWNPTHFISKSTGWRGTDLPFALKSGYQMYDFKNNSLHSMLGSGSLRRPQKPQSQGFASSRTH